MTMAERGSSDTEVSESGSDDEFEVESDDSDELEVIEPMQDDSVEPNKNETVTKDDSDSFVRGPLFMSDEEKSPVKTKAERKEVPQNTDAAPIEKKPRRAKAAASGSDTDVTTQEKKQTKAKASAGRSTTKTAPKSGTSDENQQPKATSKLKSVALLQELVTFILDQPKKLASVIALKSEVMRMNPELDPKSAKNNLKRAISKGWEEGVLKRPKNTEGLAASMSGSFRVDSVRLKQIQKELSGGGKAKTKKPKAEAALTPQPAVKAIRIKKVVSAVTNASRRLSIKSRKSIPAARRRSRPPGSTKKAVMRRTFVKESAEEMEDDPPAKSSKSKATANETSTRTATKGSSKPSKSKKADQVKETKPKAQGQKVLAAKENKEKAAPAKGKKASEMKTDKTDNTASKPKTTPKGKRPAAEKDKTKMEGAKKAKKGK